MTRVNLHIYNIKSGDVYVKYRVETFFHSILHKLTSIQLKNQEKKNTRILKFFALKLALTQFFQALFINFNVIKDSPRGLSVNLSIYNQCFPLASK